MNDTAMNPAAAKPPLLGTEAIEDCIPRLDSVRRPGAGTQACPKSASAHIRGALFHDTMQMEMRHAPVRPTAPLSALSGTLRIF